jgi:hypothetical protein
MSGVSAPASEEASVGAFEDPSVDRLARVPADTCLLASGYVTVEEEEEASANARPDDRARCLAEVRTMTEAVGVDCTTSSAPVALSCFFPSAAESGDTLPDPPGVPSAVPSVCPSAGSPKNRSSGPLVGPLGGMLVTKPCDWCSLWTVHVVRC